MKKYQRLLMCLMCIVIIFSLASCDFFTFPLLLIRGHNHSEVPEGYTGGLATRESGFHGDFEVKWVETYDELVEEKAFFEANGSEFPHVLFLDCEEYGIDIKFCIITARKNIVPKHIASVQCYLFFEPVSIEKLEYSFYSVYSHAKIIYSGNIKAPTESDIVDIRLSKQQTYKKEWRVYYNDELKFYIYSKHPETELTQEQIDIFKKTIKVL